MILSFSVRDNHPLDHKIIVWYKGLAKSDRSRLIRDIILDYLEGRRNDLAPTVVQEVVPTQPQRILLDIQPVKLSKTRPVDLDSKLDNFSV